MLPLFWIFTLCFSLVSTHLLFLILLLSLCLFSFLSLSAVLSIELDLSFIPSQFSRAAATIRSVARFLYIPFFSCYSNRSPSFSACGKLNKQPFSNHLLSPLSAYSSSNLNFHVSVIPQLYSYSYSKGLVIH